MRSGQRGVKISLPKLAGDLCEKYAKMPNEALTKHAPPPTLAHPPLSLSRSMQKLYKTVTDEGHTRQQSGNKTEPV